MAKHTFRIYRMVYDKKTGNFLNREFRVTLDTDKIAPIVINKAASNKSGKSRAMGGAIIVETQT
jgi:hypothetical protein